MINTINSNPNSTLKNPLTTLIFILLSHYYLSLKQLPPYKNNLPLSSNTAFVLIITSLLFLIKN